MAPSAHEHKPNSTEKAKVGKVDNLISDLLAHANTMGVQDPRRFLSHWPVDDAEGLQALQSEINDGAKSSAEWGKRLAKFPSSAIGVHVLQLFVQDLMDRESRQARIFGNQFESERVEEKVSFTWGMKCLAVSALIILNIFFIFACMLYGRDRGKTDHLCIFRWEPNPKVSLSVYFSQACIGRGVG